MLFCVLLPLAPWEKPWVLEAALKSLEEQTLHPELIVISCDGKPPDELQEILNQTRLNVLQTVGPGGEGTGPVLQRGLELCPADLVIRADSDDISLPRRCEKLVRLMILDSSLAALGGWVHEFRQDSANDKVELMKIRAVPSGNDRLIKFSRLRNPLNHPSTILRKSYVEQVGGYRSIPYFEDYDLWLRLLRSGFQIENIQEVLTMVRVDPKHRKRRRGRKYLKAERIFRKRCREGDVLSKRWGIAWIIGRWPLRLLPTSWFSFLMDRCLRNSNRMKARW